MAALDLKPLSENTIQKLGLSYDELWEVKIGDEVFGPFETLSLKHYSEEHIPVFEKALASKKGKEHWEKFFDITVFHKMDDLKIGSEYHGSFWFMIHGQKSEPVTKEDIETLIDQHKLNRHDGVSIDDGHTWTELCLCPIFSIHFVATNSLPKAPQKLVLIDKPHIHGEAPVEEIPETVEGKRPHLDHKVDTHWPHLKVDEIPVPKLQEVQVSPAMKWALPCAGAIAIVMYVGFTQEFPSLPESSDNSTAKLEAPDSSEPRSRSRVGSRERSPASVMPITRHQRSALTQQPDISQDEYQTQVETHSYDQDMGIGSEIDREPADAIVEPPIEESVVTESIENAEPQSLDAAMNAVPQAPVDHDPAVDQPIVEETSDF